ncbi:hypothetical protein [Pseudomonas sp. PDM08]|uniref:hypothetical protein n=1 Tax=Pseudomonas sp. PDM08 TaxID=2769265 RepID=UPI001782A6A9|nr:hypothetical protein [Pseudomonas sp. PDM08]MBD9607427.1 hypothetical protein [Pseudomonas sp. PDM08]
MQVRTEAEIGEATEKVSNEQSLRISGLWCRLKRFNICIGTVNFESGLLVITSDLVTPQQKHRLKPILEQTKANIIDALEDVESQKNATIYDFELTKKLAEISYFLVCTIYYRARKYPWAASAN